MYKTRLCFFALALQAITACSLLEEKPEPAPAPPPAPAPAPAPVVDELPYPPLPQAAPKPVPKPRPAPAPASKPGKVSAKPARPADTTEALPASAPAPASTRRASAKAAPANAPSGPDWLQYCSYRQQSGDAILCDANTLLAQPSAKVQVYVREPALVRDRIILREGLPKLYRFFVLP
ncbi:hypothetical protein Q9Q94_06545 [Uliginosibacterium sp. 31-16]|uniref:hypothetical protein n=1 Tax=Uliginosibacterium sp. 31-16 TaxID=3068315 RepID=UPI00273D4519|nr:hypothetical protein [Uliginosibacterium sp. 31-16]MDP5239179.1 hypothetical protein [Uliginosibacterium sp. 31-16]